MKKLLIALLAIFISTALISACSFSVALNTKQVPSTTSVNQTEVNLNEIKPTDIKGNALKVTKLKVLVFTKTAGYRHKSIATGRAAIKKLAQSRGFTVVSSQNSTLFSDEKSP